MILTGDYIKREFRSALSDHPVLLSNLIKSAPLECDKVIEKIQMIEGTEEFVEFLQEKCKIEKMPDLLPFLKKDISHIEIAPTKTTFNKTLTKTDEEEMEKIRKTLEKDIALPYSHTRKR